MQLLNLVFAFVLRTVFVYVLGNVYLGINGIFSNILTILSLADLGFETVLTYSLYKPLQEQNQAKINALMQYFKKIYHTISLTVLFGGLCLLPFLRYLIGNVSVPENLYLVYLLQLLNTSFSYLCAYKILIFTADQKEYIISIFRNLFMIIGNIGLIVLLLTTKAYMVYLVFQIVITLSSNVFLAFWANKKYPYVVGHSTILDKEEKKKIRKNALGMSMHKIGGVVVNGTDNILLTLIVNVSVVGYYSNYLLITNSLKKITQIFGRSCLGSVGNLNVADQTKNYAIFKNIAFLNFWIYAFCSVCLFILFKPFISLWLGSQFLLPMNVELIICLLFLIDGFRIPVQIFREAMGIFYVDRFRPLCEAILNLVISIALGLWLGTIGIFLGTLISLTFSAVYEFIVLFVYGLKTNPKGFIFMYMKFLFLSIAISIAILLIRDHLNFSPIINLLVLAIISLFGINTIFILFNLGTKEFKFFVKLLLNRIKNVFNSLKRNNKCKEG